MKKKILATLALTCALSTGLGLFTACDSGKTELPPLEFVGGYVDEIELGESILINEYVDTGVEGYALVATKGDQTITLTGRATWSPEDVGEWTLTYTVGERTVSATITVKAPPISWTYSANPVTFVVGDTLTFETALAGLNVAVDSVLDYEVFVESVKVGDETTDLKGQTSFTFTKEAVHYFTFAVESEDGQRLSAQFEAILYDPNAGPMDWLESTVKEMCTTFGMSKSVNPNPEYIIEGRTSMGFGSARDATERGIGMGMKSAALAEALDDPTVKEVTFKLYLKVANPSGTYTYQLWSYDNDAEKIEFNPNEWTTLTLTKADYVYYCKEGKGNGVGSYYTSNFTTSFKVYGNIAWDELALSDSIYLDDFTAVKGEVEQEPEEPEDPVDEPQYYYSKTDTSSVIETVFMNSKIEQNSNKEYASVGTYSDRWEIGTDRRSSAFAFRNEDNYDNLITKVFADAEVTGYSFDVYNAGTEDVSYAFVSTVTNLSASPAPEAQGTLKVGEWTTVTLTKAQFETLVAAKGSHFVSFIVWTTETPTTSYSLYLDNFRGVKAS